MIAKALRLSRHFHGIPLTKMADTVGVSKGYLSEIENGHKRPTFGIIQGYAQACGIPASELLIFSEAMDQGGFKKRAASRALKMMEWAAASRALEDGNAQDGATS